MTFTRLKLIFTVTAVFGCMLTGILLLSWKQPADVAQSAQNTAKIAELVAQSAQNITEITEPETQTAPTVTQPEAQKTQNTQEFAEPVAQQQTTQTVAENVAVAAEPTAEPVVDPVVIMIAGPGVSKRCEVTITDPETANKLMKQASAQCHFSYSGKDYASLGWFVDTIAGLSANKKTGQDWIYYVNDKLANVGVSTYHIQPGDTITWKYEQDY